MFRRRTRNDYDGDTTTATTRRPAATTDGRAYDDGQAYREHRAYTDGGAPPADVDDGRRWHHGPTRAVVTLLAVGVAGLLAWTTTNINDRTTGGYWAVYGILAGAGLVMALSQVIGGWTKRGKPTFSPTMFLVAFVPTAIVVLWITVFHQPHTGLWRGHVTNWSGDIGIAGLVKDMGGDLLTMLAFGLGLVFGFCFDTTGARRPMAAPTATRTRRAPADTTADEPIARDRTRAREQQRERVDQQDTVHS
jgi:hypothetical protein